MTAARTTPGLAGSEVGGRHLTSHRAAHGHPCREARSPLAILVVLPALLGAGPQPPSAAGKPQERISAPVLARTFPLEGVRGPARLRDQRQYGPAGGNARYNLPPADIQRLVAGFIAEVSGG